jgi:hypothetical protein
MPETASRWKARWRPPTERQMPSFGLPAVQGFLASLWDRFPLTPSHPTDSMRAESQHGTKLNSAQLTENKRPLCGSQSPLRLCGKTLEPCSCSTTRQPPPSAACPRFLGAAARKTKSQSHNTT